MNNALCQSRIALACDSRFFCRMYDSLLLWFIFNIQFPPACGRAKEFVITENIIFISVARRKYDMGIFAVLIVG